LSEKEMVEDFEQRTRSTNSGRDSLSLNKKTRGDTIDRKMSMNFADFMT